jgi:hypothetical protein
MSRVRVGARGTGVSRVASQTMAPAVEAWRNLEINGGAGANGSGDGGGGRMVSGCRRSGGAETTVFVGAPDSCFEGF